MCAQPKTLAKTRFVATGQVDLHVTEFGHLPDPLILLHGIGSDVSSWWPVIDELAVHFRLLIPDQRGHGRSQKPDTGYLIPDYTADLDGLINAYGIEQPAIVGHSLGGMVALHWAARFPGRPRKLVIEDPPLRTALDTHDPFPAWIALAGSTPAEAAAVFRRDYPHWSEEDCLRRAEMITSTHLPVFHELRAHNTQAMQSDPFAPLGLIETPTLLLFGDHDQGGLVRPEDAERFTATMKRARAVRVPGGSHSLHRDFTRPFLDAVIPFLLEP